jgi:hypothetical protein
LCLFLIQVQRSGHIFEYIIRDMTILNPLPKRKKKLTFKSCFIKPSTGQSKSLYIVWFYFHVRIYRLYLSLARTTENTSKRLQRDHPSSSCHHLQALRQNYKTHFPAEPKGKFPTAHVFISLLELYFILRETYYYAYRIFVWYNLKGLCHRSGSSHFWGMG